MAEINNFKGIVGLTEEQYNTLQSTGTLVVGDVTYTYDPTGTLYVTDSQTPTYDIIKNTKVSTWVEDTTYANFKYKAEITINDLTANDVCEVTFSQADASSGNYAQVCLSGMGTLTIYSLVNTEVTIPTIIVFKVKGEN